MPGGEDCLTGDSEAIFNEIFQKLKEAYSNLDLDSVSSKVGLTDIEIKGLKSIRADFLKSYTLNFIEFVNKGQPAAGGTCATSGDVSGKSYGMQPKIYCEKDLLKKNCFLSRDEIAGILAHEIAHLALGHFLKRMEMMARKPSSPSNPDQDVIDKINKSLGKKKGTPFKVQLTSWQKDMEARGDELGCVIAAKAGFKCVGGDRLRRQAMASRGDTFSSGQTNPEKETHQRPAFRSF